MGPTTSYAAVDEKRCRRCGEYFRLSDGDAATPYATKRYQAPNGQFATAYWHAECFMLDFYPESSVPGGNPCSPSLPKPTNA